MDRICHFCPPPPPLRGQRQTFFYPLPTTHLVHVFIEWPLIRRRLFFKSTLLFYKFEYQKERHLLILLSMLARYSSEPKLKMIFEMLWVLFERISVFYNDWPRSWISQTLGHVMDILNVIFIILQFFFFRISCTGSKVSFLQLFNSSKVALFGQKTSFEVCIMNVTVKNNICNMSQGPRNQGFRSVIVENWYFLKKDPQDFKNSFQFGFPWIPSRPVKQKVLFLLIFRIVKKNSV